MKMPHAPRQLPLLPILLVLVAVALIGSVVIGWQRWQSEAEISNRYLKEVKQAYSAATEPSDKITQAARLQAMNTLAGYIDEPDHCKGEWWYGWLADVLPSAKEAADRCEKQRSAAQPVVIQADKFMTYLQEEANLQKIIATLAINSSKGEWQTAAQASVASAEKDLATLKASKEFEQVRDTARQQVKTVSTMWRALSEASKKQDRKAYEAAVDGLDNAYNGLAIITEVSDDTIADMLDSLLVAGKRL